MQALAALVPIAWWWHCYRELQAPPRSLLAIAACIGIGLLVFALWIAPMPGWAHLGERAASFEPVQADGALRWDLIAVRLFGAVLVVPLMEELFWRSFLMRWIDRRRFLDLPPGATSAVAVLSACAVFALAHDLWLAGFIAGVIYALIYRRLANLWYAVIAHATTNLALGAWVVYCRAWEYW